MEQNNIDQEIEYIMNQRRNNMNEVTEDILGEENNIYSNNNEYVNEMRNDNDLEIVERENLLNNSSNYEDSYYNFNESYYLEDLNNDNGQMAPVMSANGELNDVLREPTKKPTEILKNKALDLESRIVDRVTELERSLDNFLRNYPDTIFIEDLSKKINIAKQLL